MEYVIALALWAVIDYFVAYFVAKNSKGLMINPVLYAVGAIIFGGIYPLIFLGVKFLYWKNSLKKAEMEELKKRVDDLENKDNE